ncbi:hypothetical protein H311_03480 [Anncaliia algerae PRA109]|nr:hypothetical protein H311_03480 [Anncaliia algerae PRA109]
MNLRISKIIIVYLMQECVIKCSYLLETETKSEKITQNNDSNSQQQIITENYQKCVSRSEENRCISLYNIEMDKNTESAPILLEQKCMTFLKRPLKMLLQRLKI